MILIIGATSFIGPSVLDSLLEKNDTVKCLIRTDSITEKLQRVRDESIKKSRANKDVLFVTGNLLSSDSILNCLREIDSIVYLVDLKNTAFLKNLLLAVSKTEVKRAVFISSTTVLVPQENRIRDLKIQSEGLIRRSDLDWTILRPTMIYGTEDDRNYSKMLRFIKHRGFFVMFGSGQNLIQPVYVRDVAEAVSQVMENKQTFKKTYEICGKNPVKYIDMLNIINSMTKKKFKVVRLPLKLSKAMVSFYCRMFPGSALKPEMIERMEYDKAYSYENAAGDFGYSPVDFEKGIENLIRHLQV